EREFMRTVLRHIAQLTSGNREPLTDEAISAMIETHAPLGLKKKMLLLVPEGEPPLDPRKLPSFRRLQTAETSDLLDQLGEHVRRDLKRPLGRIEDGQRTAVLS